MRNGSISEQVDVFEKIQLRILELASTNLQDIIARNALNSAIRSYESMLSPHMRPEDIAEIEKIKAVDKFSDSNTKIAALFKRLDFLNTMNERRRRMK